MTTIGEKDSGGAATLAPSAVRKSGATLAGIVGWLFLVLTVGAPFASAGRIGWLEAWVLLVVLALGSISSHAFVKARNPEVLEYRKRVGVGTKSWDRVWLGSFRPQLLGTVVVAPGQA